MGISTLQSYCGAQIFEAIGLESEVRRSLLHPHGVADRRRRPRGRRERSPAAARARVPDAESGSAGSRAGRRVSVAARRRVPPVQPRHGLQAAARHAQRAIPRFTRNTRALVNDQSRSSGRCAGLLDFKRAQPPIPLDEVEPVESIVKRFATGAMSYGSISLEAHETLAIAMNRMGGKSNSGEGGEDPARYTPDANGDSRRSAVKQVASARFGVTSEYLVNATTCRSRWRRAPSPAKAGSCPAPRSIRGSRRCGTRRLA